MGRSRRQSLLGVKGFAEGLSPHVTGKRKIREIPKGQRLAGRPTLGTVFLQKNRHKQLRDRLIAKAVAEYGYSQMELANHLKLHYSTISRIVTASAQQER
jgi:putative transposase